MTTIAIVNRTSVSSVAHQLPSYITPLQIQVDRDFEPFWHTGLDAKLIYVPQDVGVPSGAWPIYILDSSDEPGALGYHEDVGTVPDGKVFAKTALSAKYDPFITLSHELLELLGDPNGQTIYQYGKTSYAYEAADPVEADELGYLINGYRVSDFVTPAWFGAAKKGAIYDYMRHLTKPRTLAPGGYMLTYTKSRGWHQVFAETDGHRRPGTSGRTERRLYG